MNFKLSILKVSAIAILLCAPGMVEASQSSQIPAAQSPLQSPSLKTPVEDKLSQKFVLVMKLNDDQINRLRVNGSLITQIPPKLVNRVGKIRFKRSASFLSKSLRVVGAKTEKKNRLVSVEVDNTVLERLAYQPVEMSIYESGFDQVRLKFNPLGSVAGKLPTETQPPANPKSNPYMFVRINAKRGIYGLLKDFDTLSIETQFGKVKVPTSELAGIRLNDGGPKQAFVVLKKGDVFSGQIDMETITVQSRWGNKEIKLREVESFTLAPEFVFLRDALDSKRWQLRSTSPLKPVNSPATQSILNRNSIPNPSSTQPSQLNLAPTSVLP